jgi:ribosomal protein L11 methylase PrmA
MTTTNFEPSSFRDPNGRMFIHENKLYRLVSKKYEENYSLLMESKLYATLTESGSLITHEETKLNNFPADTFKILQPALIPFISYPYEWCFSQLKDAALLTLEIQRKAILHGMILKDASAYNVQFFKGKPVFIDTLSFQRYKEGTPWIAYRQFCQHFLAPLALMAHTDIYLSQLLKSNIDGIPLSLCKKLLPLRSILGPLGLHIFLHASQQERYDHGNPLNHSGSKAKNTKVSRNGLLGIVDSLKKCILKLRLKSQKTEWDNYYLNTNYSKDSGSDKSALIKKYISTIPSSFVIDLGSNTGIYSRIASDFGIPSVSADIDPNAVEENYRKTKERSEENLLPLIIDLTNPSPAIGWENLERASFLNRIPENATIFALALIHHLAISNNIPLEKLAQFFQGRCQYLIIEFIPKSDSQVKKLLSTREDVFDYYTQENFEHCFSSHFNLERKNRIKNSERVLYLMSKGSR